MFFLVIHAGYESSDHRIAHSPGLYDCTNLPVCQNEGFVKQVDGVCSCECVDGLSGPHCTRVNTSAGCGGTINLRAGHSDWIDMIGYLNGLTCTWLIKGPEKTTIQVYINSIGLPSSILDNCLHYIEIRDYLSGTKGKLICGNSGGARFIKKNLGPTNMMLVRFDSQYSVIKPGRGFLLTVTAAPSANATVTDSFERDFTTLMRHGTSGVDFKWTTNKYWDLHNFDIAAFDGNLMASLRKYNFGADFTYTGVAKLETSVVFTNEDNPCDNVVCQYGGKCELNVSRSHNPKFWCNCRFGFSGEFCEKC
uniref:Uncharacterized protein n=1 Tax=Magallana gigas TaxID=29159 RepID=K1QFR4_MAGGI